VDGCFWERPGDKWGRRRGLYEVFQESTESQRERLIDERIGQGLDQDRRRKKGGDKGEIKLSRVYAALLPLLERSGAQQEGSEEDEGSR